MNIAKFPPHPRIQDCHIGFGIAVDETKDGRGSIEVAKDIITPGYDGPAIRSFMEEIAVAMLYLTYPPVGTWDATG